MYPLYLYSVQQNGGISEKGIEETFELDLHPLTMQNLTNYGKSKRVGEALVVSAQKLGLWSMIYRCGTICGHEKTGGTNAMDFVNRFLQGIIQLQHAPILDSTVTFPMAPVGYVSQAIVNLSQYLFTDGGCFHLLGVPHKAPTVSQLIEYIQSFGYQDIKMLPFDEWKEYAFKSIKSVEDNVLFPLLSYFRRGRFPTTDDDIFRQDHCFEELKVLEKKEAYWSIVQ